MMPRLLSDKSPSQLHTQRHRLRLFRSCGLPTGSSTPDLLITLRNLGSVQMGAQNGSPEGQEACGHRFHPPDRTHVDLGSHCSSTISCQAESPNCPLSRHALFLRVSASLVNIWALRRSPTLHLSHPSCPSAARLNRRGLDSGRGGAHALWLWVVFHRQRQTQTVH